MVTKYKYVHKGFSVLFIAVTLAVLAAVGTQFPAFDSFNNEVLVAGPIDGGG